VDNGKQTAGIFSLEIESLSIILKLKTVNGWLKHLCGRRTVMEKNSPENNSNENGLLAAERRSKILASLALDGKVKVQELSKTLGVSEVTIRRDLSSLEKDGLLERTHGGAVSSSKSRYELSFEQKIRTNMTQKIAIASKALSLIEDGDTVMLDSGTTTFQLAKLLGEKKDLTVVTNAVNMVSELSIIADLTLVLIGGFYKPTTGATIGPMVVNELKNIHVDKFFIGCNSITLTGGLMTPDMIDAETRKAMIAASAHVIVLADSSKFGKTSFVTIAPLEEIDMIISDKGLDARTRQAFEERGVEVVLV
jgi:DeoR family fructose operon transcriptional repressor